jgi:hypothetical protein
VGCGPWVVGRGPWAVDRGLWAVDGGLWAVGVTVQGAELLSYRLVVSCIVTVTGGTAEW